MSMAPPVSSPSVTIITEPNLSISATSIQCSTSPSLIHSSIKQEESDGVEKIEKLSPRQQTQNAPIAFSITNILSNNFGRTKLPTLSPPSPPPSQYHQQYAHQNHLEQQQLFFTNILSNNFGHTDLSVLSQHHQTHHNHLQHQQLLSHYQAAVVAAQQSLHHAGSHSFIDGWPFGNKLWSPARSEPSPNNKKSVRRPSSQLDTCTSSSSIPSDSTNSVNASASVSTPNDAVPATTQTTTKDHQSNSMDSGMESSEDTKSETGSTKDENGSQLWPAWIYCTRYSDRPSSGPRYRKPKTPKVKGESDEKRPRTAFSMDQLARLKREFNENRYLTERRRQQLSSELGLNEAQIKIWFQNKRAKIKKSTGQKNPLAMQLMAQGLYNHSTVALTKEEEELEMRMNGKL